MAKKLSRVEAYEMVTPVVDGEATEAEEKSFFEFLESNTDVRQYYEEELWLKQLVKQKTEFHPAPDHLRNRILQTIASMRSEVNTNRDFAHKESPSKIYSGTFSRISLGLAALLILSLFIYLLSIFSERDMNMRADNTALPAVESHVYQYFVNHGGMLIPPDLASGSEADLHSEIASMFQNSYSIPELENIVLAGVVQSQLLPEYYTPLFEYKVDEGDIIYIFAFHIPEMENYLSRSDEAMAHCIRDTDYHIVHYQDRDIVSWKWDDNWYVGISNHDGETLVSLLPGETNR
ncbi:MAG: hypothetical protein EA363_08430 [Balneolaceae bacterium]|nr:MAG: hypothetical protein EA363_08430 [Balneolaceae bacterium]